MSHALYSNMATPALLAADINAAATSITLQSGGAALLPTITGSNYIWATLFHNEQNYGGPSEIVKITSVTGEVLTATRGQQGTTAQAYYFGDKLEIRVTADGLEEFETTDAAHDATAKTPIVDADEISIYDSAASWVLKKFTLTTLWTWIQTHLASPGAIGGTTPAAIAGTTGTFSGAVSGTTITGSATVRGNTATGTGATAALYGLASTSGTGAEGQSDSGYGVRGYSDTGRGLYGVGGTSGYGVYGQSASGYGVYGQSASGYGVVAQGDTTSPTTAAFRIVPQDTQPSTGAQGDLYINSGSGVTYGCFTAGTPGSWAASFQSPSPTTPIGYVTGAGGTVTQQTSKSTGVTLDKVCGSIVMNAAELAATTQVSFIFTNSNIGLTDIVVVNPDGFTATSYSVRAVNAAAGSCVIVLKNETAGALSEAVVVRFAVIKTVVA